LFGRDEYPLSHSLDYPGDPGLFGPESATWPVMGDAAAIVGGIRALLIQTAHPEVVAGVRDHSSYRADPLGRLSRTTSYVTATAYGAMPEVDAALGTVRRAHVPVEGTSERGISYSAGGPAQASWVHNVLTDSFLETYQRFAPDPLSVEEADRFVLEQSTLGSRLRSDDLPQTRTELNAWVEEHPAIAPTEAMADTIAFLKNPPLPTSARVGYRLLYAAAVATIPERIAQIIGVSASRAAVVSGTVMLSTLRWALGSSPSWWLALERTGSQIPDGVHFLRPPPVAGIEHRFIESTQRGSPGHRTEDRFGGSK
jgi:uncharacterized protein (DUF2236 family)